MTSRSAEAEGVDLVFAPDASEVYPPGFDTVVSVGAVARPLEGAARPGHFDGVATVVAILFDLVGADHAYFGQKDAQQVMVIRQMARDLAIATEVIACPTVREPDGLALSSRNVHLSPEERAAAPVLHRALLAARDRWEAGERSADALRDAMWETLTAEPLADVDYVSVADGTTLAELDRIDGPALLSLGGPLRDHAPHRQRAARARSGRLMPGMAAGGRILLAYLIYFAAIGAAFPYLPVFYHDIGLGLEQIGVLTALQAAIQLLLAPVWGGLADRFPHTRLTLPLAAAVATVGATILFRADDFPTVLVGSLILYAGISGIAPTLDARTLETLGTERRSRYGEVRAFGSLAFVLATLAVGFVLDAEGARALFWIYIPFLIAHGRRDGDDPPPRCEPLGQPHARDRAVPGDAGGRPVPDRVHGRLGVTRRRQRVLLDPDRRPRRQHGTGRHRLGDSGRASRSRSCTRSHGSGGGSARSGSW